MEAQAQSKPEPVCVCLYCFPKAVEIGELVPGHFLVENDGVYSIMTQNGCSDSEVLSFPCKPKPDPDPKDENQNELSEEFILATEWRDKYYDWLNEISFSHWGSYFLIKSCFEAGYDGPASDHLILDQWLVHRAGLMIENYEKTHEPLKELKYE